MDGLIMADKKARPQRSTGFNGEGGASPTVNAGKQLQYSWSLGGGDTVDPQPNPSGATPSPQTWIHGAQPTTPPNANPAAMRGYTRNAPYMEDIVNSPQGIIEELRLLGYAPEDDVVSQYRKRVLMSALRDIYNVNPYDVGPGYVMGKSMAPVTPGSK
jgi:hypothetical protein